MSGNYELAVTLMASEFKDELSKLEKAEDMLAVAFKRSRNHWMITDEQDQFKGAIGAVLSTLKSGPEYDRIVEAMQALGRASAVLNALQTGIPIDWTSLEKLQEEAPKNYIPLNKMWNETREQRP